MKTKRRKIIFSIQIIGVLISIYILVWSFILPIVSFSKSTDLSLKEAKLKRASAKTEYLKLFPENVRKYLRVSDNYVTKTKHAYINFTYDKKYEIIIHKKSLSKNLLIKDLYQIDRGNVKNSAEVVYAGYEAGCFDFKYSFEYDSICSKIDLVYNGMLTGKSFIGDSIVNFNLKTEGIAISYDSNRRNDIILKNITLDYKLKDNLMMNVSLYRKNSEIYLIIIYTNHDDSKIGENLFKTIFGLDVY